MELNLANKKYYCPYCGEKVSLVIDPSDELQDLIEDCEVCCRPTHFHIQVSIDGNIELAAQREDD